VYHSHYAWFAGSAPPLVARRVIVASVVWAALLVAPRGSSQPATSVGSGKHAEYSGVTASAGLVGLNCQSAISPWVCAR